MNEMKEYFDAISEKLNTIIALLQKPKAETKDDPPDEPPPN